MSRSLAYRLAFLSSAPLGGRFKPLESNRKTVDVPPFPAVPVVSSGAFCGRDRGRSPFPLGFRVMGGTVGNVDISPWNRCAFGRSPGEENGEERGGERVQPRVNLPPTATVARPYLSPHKKALLIPDTPVLAATFHFYQRLRKSATALKPELNLYV